MAWISKKVREREQDEYCRIVTENSWMINELSALKSKVRLLSETNRLYEMQVEISLKIIKTLRDKIMKGKIDMEWNRELEAMDKEELEKYAVHAMGLLMATQDFGMYTPQEMYEYILRVGKTDTNGDKHNGMD